MNTILHASYSVRRVAVLYWQRVQRWTETATGVEKLVEESLGSVSLLGSPSGVAAKRCRPNALALFCWLAHGNSFSDVATCKFTLQHDGNVDSRYFVPSTNFQGGLQGYNNTTKLQRTALHAGYWRNCEHGNGWTVLYALLCHRGC